MGVFEDGLAYLSQNLGYIVTIIGTGALSVRYIVAEIKKYADRIDKKVMGPEGNAKEGKGGAIDDLRTEFKRDMKAMEERINNKINNNNEQLLFEYRAMLQRVNFMIVNQGRIERSLEKITDGKYTAARLDTNREEGFNDYDNPDPNSDNGGGNADTYNKRRRRNN